ncbi:GDP-mannose mannosyl hydrolase [Hydrogenovibrio sp. 3SP14C1]|uniref:GDP-mannose mannosyl hydrolase n=1 Tax=Hydrogenovibrio sp. 3SP14C1 TaxID=3038774 RepID=UPI002416C73B|nr:GDP-mannose mannosyl hydrolase [Hydrogenovibrio sp. 3SP14C1]MDG4812251.1 GDP-mannose mannosyl hydrolase [Hydrogenovibrio sp. 3SP14C1]
MNLPIDDFSNLIQMAPLVSIDLIVESQGKYLLGKRLNSPAKNFWFVPGGRIFKNEKISDALERIAKKELNIDVNTVSSYFFGSFEHFYNDSYVSEKISTHYVVLAYKLFADMDIDELALPLAEHSKYQLFTIDEILENNCVHKHTQDYFRKLKQ